jgi:hypothetical protein
MAEGGAVMTLDEYLRRLHTRRQDLIRESLYADDMRGLVLLLQWKDIRVCCSPWWHRPYWKHAGGQYYTCSICERIAV